MGIYGLTYSLYQPRGGKETYRDVKEEVMGKIKDTKTYLQKHN